MNIAWEWEEAKELAADRTEWRQRVLPTGCGMNGIEQNNKIVFFYFVFWKYFLEYFVICKIFLKLLFENTLHNDEEWGHILSVQFLPVLSIAYFIIGQIQKFCEV